MSKRHPVDDSEHPKATSPERLDPLVPQLVDLLRRMPMDRGDEPPKSGRRRNAAEQKNRRGKNA
jgi:hypothetical protein